MSKPIFIKAGLEVEIEGHRYKHVDKPLSSYGTTGLPWYELDSQKLFGKEVPIWIHLANDVLTGKATITREQTAGGEYMGLKFHLATREHNILTDQIRRQGFFPTEYARKYPRIPAIERIRTFPLQVLGMTTEDSEFGPIIFSVENISLGGVLVSSESPFAVSIVPGSRLNLSFEPRGDFSIQVRVQGLVCRVFDEVAKPNGNLIRFFGIRFSRVDEENRHAFLELLRDVLQQIKDEQL